MTGSSGGTPQTCPNGHPVAFAGQRFCEVCRMPIGGPAGPAAPEPPPPPAFAPPPAYFAPPPAAPLPPAPYAPGPGGRAGGRSAQPMLLGLAVCLAVVAAAAFVVGQPFGGGGASPSLTSGAVVLSPA